MRSSTSTTCGRAAPAARCGGRRARAVLVGDAQRVAEAARDDEHRGLALALEQRVGGDRRAHLHRVDLLRPGSARPAPRPAARGCRRPRRRVAPGILGQQLVRDERAVGPARDDVGERAAAVDPELPARHHRRSRISRASGPARSAHSSVALRPSSRRRCRNSGRDLRGDGHACGAHALVVLRQARFQRLPLPRLDFLRRPQDSRALGVVELIPVVEVDRGE